MRAFSGIKPSGDLHIGNLFGAINLWIELQKEYEALYSVVDLHAITVPQNPEELRARSRFIAAAYLAAGVDPKRNILFIQSHVPAHAELAWIFDTVIRMSELERMTQYKDKAKVRGENVSVGLFNYPVLMAADILLYDTDIVPIGHDQIQHVELACDIAKRFNKTYGETFKIPKPVIQKVGARIMSLDAPEQKMSKDDKNYIGLMDDAETIKKRVSRAVTDSIGTIEYTKERLGISNLIEIFHHASGQPIADIVEAFSGKGYKEFKAALADALTNHLAPLQEKIRDYLENTTELDTILHTGAERANAIASKKLNEVKEKIGFVTL